MDYSQIIISRCYCEFDAIIQYSSRDVLYHKQLTFDPTMNRRLTYTYVSGWSQSLKRQLGPLLQARKVIRARRNPGQTHSAPRKKEEQSGSQASSHPLLEVDPTLTKKADFHHIVKDEDREQPYNPTARTTPLIQETAVSSQTSEDFVDDPDVPPLL